MALQIAARLRGNFHLWWKWRIFHGHEVWRVYSWWGFKTTRVYCTCGVEFTKPKPGDPPIEVYLAEVLRLRALRYIKRNKP